MDIFMSVNGPGIGLFLGAGGPVKVMNRSGGTTAIGQLLFLDLLGTDAATVGITPGATDYLGANVVTVGGGALTGASFGVYCVATSIGADNAEISVEFCGRIPTLSRHTTGATVNPGDPCVPDVGFVDFDPADTGTIIGIYHDTAAALSATSALKEVYLNGFTAMFTANR